MIYKHIRPDHTENAFQIHGYDITLKGLVLTLTNGNKEVKTFPIPGSTIQIIGEGTILFESKGTALSEEEYVAYYEETHEGKKAYCYPKKGQKEFAAEFKEWYAEVKKTNDS